MEQVCETLDKLTLDALTLMEQHIQHKLSIENEMKEGEYSLAKSRYVMGHKNVSVLQLPTSDSDCFSAAAVVNGEDDAKLFGSRSLDLQIRKQAGELDEDEVVNPMKWFGVLVPQSLHNAQSKYRQALLWCIQSANVQSRLRETCNKISQLKDYKLKLAQMEE